jgi:Uncharacterized protein conserved in bacteria (DUF2066)
MALRLVTAIAETRARPLACIALLLLLWAAPVLAEDSDGAFSATVKVDATADSAAAAREAARIDGQRRALTAVIERLSGSEAKPPKLDDKAVTDMVDSFEVANERMSAVRYIADYTFHFRPSKVRRLVRVTESNPPETGSKTTGESTAKTPPDTGTRPIVVLPVFKDGTSFTLWEDPNGWRAAWEQRAAGGSGAAHLTLPLGDAKDLAAIDAEKAGSGKSEALASIAQRNGASETVVALATARRQDRRLAGLEVSVKRYRYGHLIDTQGTSFDADPGESEADFLKRTANAVAGDTENGSKKSAGSRSDQQTSLSVTIPITSLAEWLQVRERLASIGSIRKVDLLSLNRQEARIEIKYVGTQDQLKSSLSEANLDLGRSGPIWRIQPSGLTSSR